ncbi:MAG TPA: pyruvate kinase [Bacteroidales bacterium]|nr:pyruvate kinase [Bacteroidales bacterium]HRX95360.1 pyruvate kinase [Bacteroidales bacterium]
MKLSQKKLERLHSRINSIIDTAQEMELQYKNELEKTHPTYRKSALNLVHYMALRSHYIEDLQQELRLMGLPGLSNCEGHVMRSLLAIKTILNYLSGNPKNESHKGTLSIKKSGKIMNANTRALFGNKGKKRRTRIMVTIPNTAASDKTFVNRLIKLGMNSARINCAHDNTDTWSKMITNIREASVQKHKQVKVMMDLGGPKLRTGTIVPGPQVIHIKPEKDEIGRTTNPALIWLAPAEVSPPANVSAVHIPVEAEWLGLTKRGDEIRFKDSRDKKCKFQIIRKQKEGKWATTMDSAYISPGVHLEIYRQNEKGEQHFEMGELAAISQNISLSIGDKIRIHKDPTPGEPAKYDENGALLEMAHLSCTLPEIFKDVKEGEPILFDDGKIEGIIESRADEELIVKIINAKESGSKLQADKGINLPISDLSVTGLTQKDMIDLEFVAKYADAVNVSFVNDKNDVEQLLTKLKELKSDIGIVLKIETRKGFNNLPQIMLSAMQTYPVGVMIARGDLAIETGWKNIATIQEEILRICEAAHVPDIWATQVLENMAKKGLPSRAEITDAAAAQRAECVMLNKGPHIEKAVKLLDRILRRMQNYQRKKEVILERLEFAEELSMKQEYA